MTTKCEKFQHWKSQTFLCFPQKLQKSAECYDVCKICTIQFVLQLGQQEVEPYLVTLDHKVKHQLCICLWQVELYWPLAPCLLIFMVWYFEAQHHRLPANDDQSVAPAPISAAVWMWARPLVARMQQASDACQS